MGGELVALGLITGLLIGHGYRRTRPIRRAKALIALYGQHKEPEMAAGNPEETAAREMIRGQGYYIAHIYDMLDEDCDGEREVLFRGRWKGDSRAHIAGDTEEELYRALVRGDGTGYVISGW